jgi:hypothetical protein
MDSYNVYLGSIPGLIKKKKAVKDSFFLEGQKPFIKAKTYLLVTFILVVYASIKKDGSEFKFRNATVQERVLECLRLNTCLILQ